MKKCTICGKLKPELTVKRVQFSTFGKNYRTLKTRTVAWLCNDCRDADPDWHRERSYYVPVEDTPDPEKVICAGALGLGSKKRKRSRGKT